MTSTAAQRAEPSPASPDTTSAAAAANDPHPGDALVRDPSDMDPLGDEQGFAAILEGMVADLAPRLFAVVQEYGDRVDARIAAWGMAFPDHVEVVGAEGGMSMSMQSPEDALRGFHFGSHLKPRLVWVNPDAATHTEDDEAA